MRAPMLELDDIQHILLTRTPAMTGRYEFLSFGDPAGGRKDIAGLTISRDLDELGLLENVTTFNFHPHLPHYELTTPQSDALRVLGRQRVDPNRPHPFTAAGNTEFNALIWMPPAGARAGDIVLVDSTNFTTLFGGTESFWSNLASMR